MASESTSLNPFVLDDISINGGDDLRPQKMNEMDDEEDHTCYSLETIDLHDDFPLDNLDNDGDSEEDAWLLNCILQYALHWCCSLPE